jgi:site-specific DNA-methyltransferase (adenine-specific)
MITSGLMSSKTNEWSTPNDLFQKLDLEFHFTLDPCCTHENAKCKKHFTSEENGLMQNWSNDIVFMNPPYGRQIGNWIKKAHESSLEGATIVCLIPARTDTIYWHKHIWDEIKNKPRLGVEIRFIKGRIKFGEYKSSAPFPSAIIVFSNLTRI